MKDKGRNGRVLSSRHIQNIKSHYQEHSIDTTLYTKAQKNGVNLPKSVQIILEEVK